MDTCHDHNSYWSTEPNPNPIVKSQACWWKTKVVFISRTSDGDGGDVFVVVEVKWLERGGSLGTLKKLVSMEP